MDGEREISPQRTQTPNPSNLQAHSNIKARRIWQHRSQHCVRRLVRKGAPDNASLTPITISTFSMSGYVCVYACVCVCVCVSVCVYECTRRPVS